MNDKSLRQIDEELPNGFHDARLQTLVLDLTSDRATMRMQVFTGQPDASTEEEREEYKGATLTLDGLVYFVIDPPDPKGRFSNAKGVFIDAGDATKTDNPRAPRPCGPLPPGVFAYWFYVNDWNSFIHVAARSATLEWE